MLRARIDRPNGQDLRLRLKKYAVDLPAARPLPTSEPDGPATISTDHIDQLCREVETRFKELVFEQINDYWSPPRAAAGDTPATTDQRSARKLEIEIDAYLHFAEERGSGSSSAGTKRSDRCNESGITSKATWFKNGDLRRATIMIHAPGITAGRGTSRQTR